MRYFRKKKKILSTDSHEVQSRPFDVTNVNSDAMELCSMLQIENVNSSYNMDVNGTANRSFEIAPQLESQSPVLQWDGLNEADCTTMHGALNDVITEQEVVGTDTNDQHRSKRLEDDFPTKNNQKAKGNTVDNLSAFPTKCSTKQCKELFENTEAMQEHESSYHKKGIKKTFQCYLCRKSIKTKRAVQSHMSSIHMGKKSFKCPIASCSKVFATKGNAMRHMNGVHNQAFPFKCMKCPKKFNHASSFKYHVAHCKHRRGKTIASKKSLQRYRYSKQNARKKFKCPMKTCPKSYSSKSNLKRHINNKHAN